MKYFKKKAELSTKATMLIGGSIAAVSLASDINKGKFYPKQKPIIKKENL